MVSSTDLSKAVVPVLVLLFVALWFYSTRRFVLSLALCYFVFVFLVVFSIAITSLGEERANLIAFRTFVRFALVWFCLFPLHLGVWDGLWLVIVALPVLFSYHFFTISVFVCLWTAVWPFSGTKLSFWLSACSVLIVVPLL